MLVERHAMAPIVLNNKSHQQKSLNGVRSGRLKNIEHK
jgi:hypothetical protein